MASTVRLRVAFIHPDLGIGMYVVFFIRSTLPSDYITQEELKDSL